MKENVKGILFIVIALVAAAGAYYLYTLDYVGYAIVGATAFVILIIHICKRMVKTTNNNFWWRTCSSKL